MPVVLVCGAAIRACKEVSSTSRPYIPQERGSATPPLTVAFRRRRISSWTGGINFPEEVVVDPKRGLSWCCRVEQCPRVALLPVQSWAGTRYNEQPEFDVPLHADRINDVDRLSESKVPCADIASIVDASPEVIADHLQAKMEVTQREKERRQHLAEDRVVEVRWHQTLPPIVRNPELACLAIELIKGKDRVVGQLDPISLQQLIMEGCALPCAAFQLNTTVRATPSVSRLSTWLFP